jgi:two-component system, LuxR family, sensor kinase FixL
MNLVAIIWSMAAAVSLTLGAIHCVVWFQDRKAWANLLFSVMAAAVAGFAGFELAMMQAQTVAQYVELHRWVHVPLFIVFVALVGFIHFYFRTGRRWLAWTIIGLRLVVLIINFASVTGITFRSVTGLLPSQFLGSTISVPVMQPNPWSRLAEGSGLLLLAFVVDASLQLWRRGTPEERRKALVVGGSLSLFVFLTMLNAILVHTGALRIPYFLSLFFVCIIVTMGYELSRDVIHAAQMAVELRENAESTSLAASSAQLALWRWDIQRDVFWISPHGRQFYGLPEREAFNLKRFLDTVHPGDLEATQQAISSAIKTNGNYRAEYRVSLPDGSVRWIGARGKVEFNDHQQPQVMRGVSGDITDRKTAELEAAQHRTELAHLMRVTTLSELSGSLAHELNQPLAIILSNAQAAQRLLVQSPPDVEEVRDILTDIVSEDRRAGEVIQRLRALLKRGETTFLPISANEIVNEVLHLTHADMTSRGVTLTRDFAADLPPVNGDRVQLQQVVLNLILNGADAMSDKERGTRKLHVSTRQHKGRVRVSIADEGCGLPANVEQIFEPFFTTKPQGLGLGLAICRSIVKAHHGQLWAEPNAASGATFHFELPALPSRPG